MKKCFKCREIKPLGEFYAHPQMPDGHLNKCKTCAKRDRSENYRARKDYYKAHDRKRNKQPHRRSYIARNNQRLRQEYPERYKEYRRREKQRHPERHQARTILGNAVRDGKIHRQPCAICGTTENVHGHHPDYSRPLNVVWLCATHHGEEHQVPF